MRAAIRGGDGECILELVNAGADVNQESVRGTPLSTAACLGDVSTIKLLVRAVFCTHKRTHTYMHMPHSTAACLGNVPTIRLLVITVPLVEHA